MPGLERGTTYKYHIDSRFDGYRVDKADPFAMRAEVPPRTASVVWDLDYNWQDAAWMAGRRAKQTLQSPVSIYEMHLGSWRRVPEDGNRSLTYREIGRAAGRARAQPRLHARRVPADHGAPVLRLVGLPERPATSRPRRATARRRTSCTWSTTCTSTASA